MPLTPQITLTATLEDFTGALVSSAGNQGKLRIALCGYGPVIPVVAGTAIIAKPGPFDLIAAAGVISIELWGNDVITPAGTYYSIMVLDGDDNVVQCGMYQFSGTETVDLSNATPIVPPLPGGSTLAYLPCTGAVPGTVYTAPGAIVALFYNGVALPYGQALPTLSYTTAANVATLNFATEAGDPNDRIDALCFVNP